MSVAAGSSNTLSQQIAHDLPQSGNDKRPQDFATLQKHHAVASSGRSSHDRANDTLAAAGNHRMFPRQLDLGHQGIVPLRNRLTTFVVNRASGSFQATAPR
jgi:hypothetical protein